MDTLSFNLKSILIQDQAKIKAGIIKPISKHVPRDPKESLAKVLKNQNLVPPIDLVLKSSSCILVNVELKNF